MIVEQIEDSGDGQADGGDQGVDNPQTVQRPRGLLNAQGFRFGEIGSLNTAPFEQAQQEQGQGGGDSGSELDGEGLGGEDDAVTLTPDLNWPYSAQSGVNMKARTP